jgi:hypothetical protein
MKGELTEMENDKFAARLRELAEVYERNPGAARISNLTDSHELLFCFDKESAAATIKAFGPGTKTDDGNSIRYYPDAWPEIVIHIFKDWVCERIVTGTREVPEVNHPEIVIPARTTPAHTEEIVEWRCGSLLNVEAQ